MKTRRRQRGGNEETAFYNAIHVGNLEKVLEFLQAGINVNKEIINGFAPLYIASLHKHLEIVKVLLEAGADINKQSNMGATPLYIASEKGHLEIVKALLEAGADINKAIHIGATPLYIASEFGHLEVVKALLEARADINKPMNNGISPLYIASGRGYLQIVKALLEAGADINMPRDTGKTPLFIASEMGKLEIVKALLEAGADINTAANDGRTPLFTASGFGYIQIVKALLEAGADINKAMNTGKTPLYAVAEAEGGSLEVLKTLLEAGADINKPANDGRRPLYIASEMGNFRVVKVLLEARADINMPRDTGATPLLIASEIGHVEIVKALLAAGADMNKAMHNGNTPLFIVSEMGYLEIVKVLLAAGADINMQAEMGLTPLHIASEMGYVDIVKVLLKAGADKNIVDHRGKRPVDIAKNEKIKKLLMGVNLLWKGFTKRDAETLQLLFSEVVHPEQLHQPAQESLYSHCPICLKYISHEQLTCMYMSHNCPEMGGFYHETLWNRYKHQKVNALGVPTGKEVVTWCTLCGRICKHHQHYALESHTTASPTLLKGGAPYESDCRKSNGGGGWPEKLARHRRLLEYAQELNEEVGKILEDEALQQLIEEVWNAPLIRKRILTTLAKEKRFNIPESVFPNIPDAGNIVSGAVPVKKSERTFQIGIRKFLHKNDILYDFHNHELNTDSKENDFGEPAHPVYQEFYKRFEKWDKACKEDIPFTGSSPLLHNPAPEGFVDPTFSGDDTNIVQLRHIQENGIMNDHSNPETDMISRGLLFDWVTSSMNSGERLGFCWKPECTAKLHPQELLSVIELSDYSIETVYLPPMPPIKDETDEAKEERRKKLEEKAREKMKEEDIKTYERYNELFKLKFCKVQLGGSRKK